MKGRLKVLRAERDLTQEGLGLLVGVSRYAINALETQRHDPSLSLAYKIAAAFDLPVEEVFANPYREVVGSEWELPSPKAASMRKIEV